MTHLMTLCFHELALCCPHSNPHFVVEQWEKILPLSMTGTLFAVSLALLPLQSGQNRTVGNARNVLERAITKCPEARHAPE